MFYLINLLNVKVSNETTKLYIDLCFIRFFKLNLCTKKLYFHSSINSFSIIYTEGYPSSKR